MMAKLVLAQTSAAFTAIPKNATNTAIDKLMDSNHAVLATTPWNIDGRSIVDL